jgi:(1->4)-alpha-D-glucan 1-alpha-D-glucosylmutase
MNVLSEIPDEWRLNLMKWGRLNRKKKIIIEGQAIPDRNEEYYLYQTLIGAWPFNIENDSAYRIFVKRIQDHMIKAVREAKVNTSWINPHSEYEEAVIKFTEKILSNYAGNQFLSEFNKFQKKIAHYGLHNSLSQTLLKITSPGVPDFYQGTELWDFSLVDPDNRKSVDYSLRRWLFFEMKDKIDKDLNNLIEELLSTKEDGRVKMFLTYRALAERQKHKELFVHGNYFPLETEGKFSENIVAFAREYQNSVAVTVVPRLLTQVIKEDENPLGGDVWLDTHVILPDNSPQEWLNVITFKKIKLNKRAPVGEALKHFSVALLVSAT